MFTRKKGADETRPRRRLFGVLAPVESEHQEEQEDKEEQEEPRRRFDRTKMTLLGVAVFGLALVSVGNISSLPHIAKDLCITSGESLLIAALLGLTVDVFFKRELVRDAFTASFGYCLHESIRAEARWILGHQLVCVSHDQHFKLKRHPGSNRLKLEVEVWRKITNVSNRRIPYTPLFAVDEWFYPEESGISVLEAFRGKQRLDQLTAAKAEKASVRIDRGCIEAKLKKIMLEPGETISLHYLGHETKRESDSYCQLVTQPTTQPTISVDYDTGIDLDYDVTFGNRGAVVKMGSHWHLQATLLPYQAVTLRWWPKNVVSGPATPEHPLAKALQADAAIQQADSRPENGAVAPVPS